MRSKSQILSKLRADGHITDEEYKMLEQDSCEDWYDVPSDEMTLEQARQAVKDLRKELAEHLEQEPKMVHRETLEQVMWERDVAINQLKELGYGFGEKIKTDEEAISRHAAIVALDDRMSNLENVDMQIAMGFAKGIIYDLPSVNSQDPKTGHWIDSPNGYFTHCSECGLYGDKGIYKHYGRCPKCGAKMVEPQERSEE